MRLKSIFIKQIAWVLLCVSVIIYFAWYGICGEFGFLRYGNLQHAIECHTLDLNKLRITRLELESRARLLHPNSVDLDVIDEIARGALGLVGTSENIILLENKDR